MSCMVRSKSCMRSVNSAMPRRMERPGVVDEDVRAAVLFQHPFRERGASIGVRDVGGMGDEGQAARRGLLFGGFKLFRVARRDEDASRRPPQA